MIIGGYKKDSLHWSEKDTFVYLDELSIVCTYEELVRIATFFSNAANRLEGYTFPYGECTLQFRDEDNSWSPEERDIVLVVTGSEHQGK